LALAIAFGAVSCAEDGPIDDENTDESEETKVGNLTLSLTGYDSEGRQYRLRNGQFYVANSYGYYGCFGCDGGANVTVLSTELDPNAATLTTTLVPGTYVVQLQDNWYIERLTPTGPERIERAVLLSEPLQYSWIYHGGASYLEYRFGVDGDLIDFRHGELTIGSEFELPGDTEVDAGWGPPRYDSGLGGGYDGGAFRSDAGAIAN
jgi:hypothetical protein